MEKSDIISPKKKPAGTDYMCRIIAVQFFVCAFMVLLIFLVCKSGGAESFKEKYREIMSDSLSVSEVFDSAKDVAESVMKPVSASKTIEVTVDEPKQTNARENTNPQTEERTVAQVMSIFSDSGDITVPAHGKLSSFFGYRTDPISGVRKLHSGIDIAVSEGTRVCAAWDGLVTSTGYDSTAGSYVWMVHKNGCETLYCHCSELLVKEGDVLRAGEVLAFSGNTGYSTGPHLHFGIRKDGEMIDPLTYLTTSEGSI